jgi:hypothetical protein
MRKASGGAASGGAAAAGGYTTPAADLARLLSDYPDALLPASVVPEWNVATKTFSLPPAVHAALLGGPSTKAFGAVGRAPLSAERSSVRPRMVSLRFLAASVARLPICVSCLSML